MLKLALLSVALTAPAAHACNQAQAKSKIVAAIDSGFIHDMRFEGGAATLQVNRATWVGISLEAKEGVIDALHCAVAGPGKVLRAVNVKSVEGRLLAEWTGRGKRFKIFE